MLLTIEKTVNLVSAPADVWALLQQPERVAACLPNVQDFRPDGEPDRYATLLVERLGPFAVRIPLNLDVAVDASAQRVVARVSGEDRAGQARVRGEVRASVRAADGEGCVLTVSSDVEVLGRMATLGAVPIRRRGDQVFDQFVSNLVQLLETGGG
jgi:carbon monoxide dehydrogenase subunit G